MKCIDTCNDPNLTLSPHRGNDGPLFPQVRRLLQVGLSAAALAACSSLLPVEVPAAIAAPAGQSVGTVANAKGVQIYECRQEKGADTWVFVGPEATLYDAGGRAIGSHGPSANGGPYWQALDGSRIVGAVKGRVEAPQAGAIPWLILSSKAEGPQGSFSAVKNVQRIDTVGGVAPGAGCAAGNHGERIRVPYTATYRFLVESPRYAGFGY